MKHKLCVLKSKKLLAFFAELLPKLSHHNQDKLLKQGEMLVSNKKKTHITLSETKSAVHECQQKHKER